MSIPFWSKEVANSGKKPPRKASGVRNVNVDQKPKDDVNNRVITDLLAELQKAVGDKLKLQTDFNSLKFEVVDLRSKNDDLLKIIEGNRLKFEKDFNKLQDEIKVNEYHLITNSKHCLLEQKKHHEEMKSLKSENEKLKLIGAKIELESMDKVKNLENELKLSQNNCKNLQSNLEENGSKINKYKSKLRYAISIINELNNILIQTTSRPDMFHTSTQTESDISTQDVHFLQSPPNNKSNFDTENILLSDIFFKSKSFCENELAVFSGLESSVED